MMDIEELTGVNSLMILTEVISVLDMADDDKEIYHV